MTIPDSQRRFLLPQFSPGMTSKKVCQWLGLEAGDDTPILELAPPDLAETGDVVVLMDKNATPPPSASLVFASNEQTNLGDNIVAVPDEQRDGLIDRLLAWTDGPDTTQARVDDKAMIDPAAILRGPVRVDAGALISAGAVILGPVWIESGARIGSGAVIGAEGFGYRRVDGAWKPRRHGGSVWIQKAVDIGANATIARGLLGPTVVGAGSKLDCLVHVAHNVQIGKHCMIAAQVGIAGSTTLGEGVVIGGQAGISDHVTLADSVEVGAQSGLGSSVSEPGSRWFGSPARPIREALRLHALLRRLIRGGSPGDGRPPQ